MRGLIPFVAGLPPVHVMVNPRSFLFSIRVVQAPPLAAATRGGLQARYARLPTPPALSPSGPSSIPRSRLLHSLRDTTRPCPQARVRLPARRCPAPRCLSLLDAHPAPHTSLCASGEPLLAGSLPVGATSTPSWHPQGGCSQDPLCAMESGYEDTCWSHSLWHVDGPSAMCRPSVWSVTAGPISAPHL